ncbi:MAG: aminotransferase class V-fold PLP-dependent enzyme, partial [Sphingomonadaceae bacterium]|nr:aminotransferase class V-fold PLP-dependent enzyme [Sphingomonadaceae bacterium]
LNNVPEIARVVHAHSAALLYVDAVQSVPHVVTDIATLGCDFLVCSPYKFFGPHQGVLWGRASVIGQLEAYKVRPASSQPHAVRFETGTQSFEGQAGVLGTIAYLEGLGEGANRRDRLCAAMRAITTYERELGEHLLRGLATIDDLKLWGLPTMDGRVPTFSFTLAGHRPDRIAAHLAARGIFAWSGHFYATEVLARLGLDDKGGLLRVGLCHYSTVDEVDRLIAALGALVPAAGIEPATP